MPATVSGWSAIITIATITAGVVLILFGEKEIGIITLASAGISGATAAMTFQKSRRGDKPE
jgi:hypothetical protein